MKILRLLAFALAGALGCLPPAVLAQGAPPAQAMSQDQLDGLLAPIALYPDELLTQVLIARNLPAGSGRGRAVRETEPDAAGPGAGGCAEGQDVGSERAFATAFPQVLDMMNDKLEWTQRLGDAFLADEAGVMRTVQSLRQRAVQAGNLNSNEQQRVVVQEKNIVIEPAQPQTSTCRCTTRRSSSVRGGHPRIVRGTGIRRRSGAIRPRRRAGVSPPVSSGVVPGR